eukprot:757269-Hanusia_phi.AAC.2
MHGLAMNVKALMTGFEMIVPCGIQVNIVCSRLRLIFAAGSGSCQFAPDTRGFLSLSSRGVLQVTAKEKVFLDSSR